MHTQTIIALSLLSIGISAIAVIRVNRGEQIGDEFTDADCRTAALAEMVNEATPALQAGERAARGRLSTGQVALHDSGVR